MPLLYPLSAPEARSVPETPVSSAALWWGALLSLVFAAALVLPDTRFFQKASDYLPLHTILEFMALAVSCMLFGLGWSLQGTRYNSRFVFISAAFLYVALVDLAHVLAFPGMPDLFTPAGTEKTINFWLAARIGTAIGIYGVIFLPIRQWSAGRCHLAFGLSAAIALITWWVGLAHPERLPRTFIPGEGLTPFKVATESLLAAAYALAAILLYRRSRRERDPGILWLAVAAWGLAMTELFFSFYDYVVDTSNVLGHIYKVIAYWMIYRSIFAEGVTLPYRAMAQREERLEGLVAARTAQLKAALDQSRSFIEQAPIAIAMFDRDMEYLAASDRWLREYGGGLAVLAGRRFAELHPDVPAHWLEAHRAALAGAPQSREEDLWVRKDGSRLWLGWRVHPWMDERGDIGGIIISVEDVTERKAAELALQDSERRLALALSASGSAVWELDVATDILRGEDSLYTLLGYTPGELSTLADWMACVHPDDRPGLPELVEDTIRGGRDKYAFEARLRAKDGSWRWQLSQAVAAERDGQGRALRLVGTHTDISARKTTEAEIQRLNAELEQRVQRRTVQLEQSNEALMRSNMELQRFAHAAAHDLQTPLRSIVGFTQLLQRELQGCTDERAGEWMSLVIDNTRRLQNLIQELLAYSRLDAQARPFELVDLNEVFDQVEATLAAPIQEAGAEVGRGELPAVLADRTQMTQLLQNLIENGIKYNRSQPPRVSVTCERGDGEWVFAVADNGIGIDPRHHERIFEIFRRLHSHQEIPGTGIGLAICHRVVERHGGRIWVDSRAGQGSVFHFALPTEPEEGSFFGDARRFADER